MLTMIRTSGAAVAVVVAIVALLATQGSLGAQTAPTPTAASDMDGMVMASPTAGSDMTMASPVAGTPVSGEQTIPGTGERVITVPTPAFAETPLPAAGGDAMGAMMDNCLDMMDMMMGGGMMDMDMMGGGMPGPMGDGGMPGPMGGGGMPGPMDSPMEQCLSTMGAQSWDNRSDLMTFSTDQCQAMLGGDSMSGR